MCAAVFNHNISNYLKVSHLVRTNICVKTLSFTLMFNRVFNIVTKLQTRLWKSGISFFHDKVYLTKASKLARVPHSLVSNRYHGYLGVKQAGLEVVTMFLLPKLRMHEANLCSPMRLNGVVLNYAQEQFYALIYLCPETVGTIRI